MSKNVDVLLLFPWEKRVKPDRICVFSLIMTVFEETLNESGLYSSAAPIVYFYSEARMAVRWMKRS